MSSEDKAQDNEVAEWERNQRPPATDVSFTYTPAEFGYGPAACKECGEAMPLERRAMGRKLCTACQTDIEAKKKKFFASPI